MQNKTSDSVQQVNKENKENQSNQKTSTKVTSGVTIFNPLVQSQQSQQCEMKTDEGLGIVFPGIDDVLGNLKQGSLFGKASRVGCAWNAFKASLKKTDK